MNHLTCMSFPHKHNVLKTSSNHNKCKKSLSHKVGAETICNAVCYSSMKTSAQHNSPHKVKRLKTRKERNQIRDQERNGSHTSPQHSRKTARETAQHHGCHLKHSYRKEKPFAKPFLPQKPSIITEGRLTSIRGLFSHEIRSLDIERLVSEQIKEETQRKQSMKHMTSPLPPHPPSRTDSDQDCILNEVQEPEKTKKGSKKELTGKCLNAFRTNKEVTESIASSRQDENPYRSAKTRKEDTNHKSRPDSSSSHRGTYDLLDLSSPENKLARQICSTPVEASKNILDFPEIDFSKSHNENIITARTSTTDEGVINIQRLESTSTMVGFPNIEVPQKMSKPSLSKLDSGTETLTDNIKEGENICASVREAVKRLAARLELHVPRRPLLEECREALLQALQKTHSFHLQHNLHKLRSLFNEKQTTSFGSGETHEDCTQIHFGHGPGHEDGEHRRNMEIWTENAVQQKYIAREVKQDSDRGASVKKRRVHSQMTSSPSLSLLHQLQSHTEMIDQCLQFEQSRTSRLSQDCFRAQDYPTAMLFEQDQTFPQLAAPIPSTPTWVSHPFEPCSQELLGDLQTKGESIKNFGLDLSHQWEKNIDPMFNLYHKYQNRKQKAQETFLGKSHFWSNQLQDQDVRKRWAPLSFSASNPSEGFQYKPFFRFPHPSNPQHRSDCLGMTVRARSNTPDRAFYHYWG